MNREQRRKQQRIEAKQRKSIRPYVLCEAQRESGLDDGDIFTIAGWKQNKDGTFNKNCILGEETKFVAKTVEAKQ